MVGWDPTCAGPPDGRRRGGHGPDGVGMKASIGKNLSALMVAQIATAAISIVVLVLAPRRLGDVQFGELTVALTFLMFFDLVALLGTNIFLVKSIARDPSRVGPYVFNTLVMKVCLGGVLAVLAITLSHVIG